MTPLRIDRLTPPPDRLTSSAGPLAERCHHARSPLARLIGLLGTPDLGHDEGLWLERCRSVHSLGLRAPIGAAFVDAQGEVLRVIDPLPRWRVHGCRRARAVVECRAGVLAGVRPGDRLRRAAPRPDGGS